MDIIVDSMRKQSEKFRRDVDFGFAKVLSLDYTMVPLDVVMDKEHGWVKEGTNYILRKDYHLQFLSEYGICG